MGPSDPPVEAEDRWLGSPEPLADTRTQAALMVELHTEQVTEMQTMEYVPELQVGQLTGLTVVVVVVVKEGLEG